MAAEKETDVNSLKEGKRLEKEASKLKPHHDHKSGKDIKFVCLPTEVDGKVKFVWSEKTTSMQNCYVCGSKPSELALRNGPFTPDRKALYFGFSPLHVKMRTFDWGNIGCGVSSWEYNISLSSSRPSKSFEPAFLIFFFIGLL